MATEIKVIQVQVRGLDEAIKEFSDMNNVLKDQMATLKALKKEKDKDTEAISRQTVEIIKQKAEIQVLGKEIKDEIVNRKKLAKQIDDETESRLKAIDKQAKLAMRQQVQNAQAQSVIEKNSQAETLAAAKAEAQAAKKVGYINELRLSVDRLEQEYYQLSKAELDNVNVGGKMLNDLTAKRAELSKIQQSYGKHTLEVGNYSSATKMLGINLGQVMKEMPNFAISARIGIMSLTNNLPMLAESIKAVREEQIAAKKAQEGLSAAQKAALPDGGKLPSMFSLVTKSIFGLTGVMSIAMVLMQLYSKDISDWVVSIFKGKDATDKFTESQKALIKTLTDQNGIAKSNTSKIYELGVAIDKYKEGTGDAKKIIEDYNSTLGVHYGKLDDINKVMAAYPKYADDYIRWSIKMSAAMLQVDEAAKIQLNIQKTNETLVASFSNDNIKKVEAYNNSLKKIYEDDWSGKVDKATTQNKLLLLQQSLSEIRNYTEINKLLGDRAVNQNKLNAILKSAKELYPGDFSTKEDKKETTKKEGSEKWERMIFGAPLDPQTVERMKTRLAATLENIKKTINDSLEKEVNTPTAFYNKQINSLIKLYEDGSIEFQEFSELLNTILQGASDEGVTIFKQLLDKLNAINGDVSNKQNDALKKQIDGLVKYGEAAYQLFGGLSDFTSGLAERELQNWARVNKGKAGFDEEYAKKKAKLDHDNAVREKALNVFSAIINTASGIAESLPNIPLSVIVGAAGLAQVAAILATPIPDANISSSSNSNSQTSQVTEKYHTGKEPNSLTPNSQLKSDEIHSTLLKAETVLDPRSSMVFNSILGNIKMLGGSENITKSVGINADSQMQVMEIAFTRALARQKAPILDYSQFTTFVNKQVKFEQNTRI